MEVNTDTEIASRIRALPLSTSENQGSNKPKKTSNDVNINPRDFLFNPSEKAKTLYSNSDCPLYIIHVYSHSNDLSRLIRC